MLIDIARSFLVVDQAVPIADPCLAISSVPPSGVRRLSGVGLLASPVVMPAGASWMTRHGRGTQHSRETLKGRADERATSTSSPLITATSNCAWPVMRNIVEQNELRAHERTRYLGCLVGARLSPGGSTPARDHVSRR
jgi:hypothetical protein